MKTLYLDGKAVAVTESVYYAYWQSREAERYRNRKEAEYCWSESDLDARGVPESARQGEGQPSAETIFWQNERHRLIEKALAELEDGGDWLLALILKETTERALAKKWGISPGAVHKRRQTALKKLRQRLEKEHLF